MIVDQGFDMFLHQILPGIRIFMNFPLLRSTQAAYDITLPCNSDHHNVHIFAYLRTESLLSFTTRYSMGELNTNSQGCSFVFAQREFYWWILCLYYVYTTRWTCSPCEKKNVGSDTPHYAGAASRPHVVQIKEHDVQCSFRYSRVGQETHKTLAPCC